MDKETKQPDPSRPYVPGYGIPGTNEGLLPWSYVQERMQTAMNYWISTANAKGQPHATPVWGVWVEDIFYFDGSPKTRRGREMAANPLVSVHLEDGSQVVILEGEVHELKQAALELRQKISAAYKSKYSQRGYAPDPDTWKQGGLYAFRPQLVFAWTQFPQDTTRWQIEE
jgi:hypothetical protein